MKQMEQHCSLRGAISRKDAGRTELPLTERSSAKAKTVPSAAKSGHNLQSLKDGLKAVPFKEFSFSAACKAVPTFPGPRNDFFRSLFSH
jgi:hypothetical protein